MIAAAHLSTAVFALAWVGVSAAGMKSSWGDCVRCLVFSIIAAVNVVAAVWCLKGTE